MLQENMFYTKEHEWICFKGGAAYVGVSSFKLIGIHKIDDIRLFKFEAGDILKKGTPMLKLFYKEYVIPLHAPIDCKLLEIHNIIEDGTWEQIIADPEEDGWLFMVEPIQKDISALNNQKYYRERFPISLISQP